MATKKLHTALASFIFLAAIVSPAAQDTSLETQLLDAMSKLSGVHPGFRANHATGIVVAGSFEATPHAAQLSKAVLFSGLKIPATARFSDVPNIADIVLNSLKFLPVSGAADFRDMLLAKAESPPKAPKPTPIRLCRLR